VRREEGGRRPVGGHGRGRAALADGADDRPVEQDKQLGGCGIRHAHAGAQLGEVGGDQFLVESDRPKALVVRVATTR